MKLHLRAKHVNARRSPGIFSIHRLPVRRLRSGHLAPLRNQAGTARDSLQVQTRHDYRYLLADVARAVFGGGNLLARRPVIPEIAQAEHALRKIRPRIVDPKWPDDWRHSWKTGEAEGGQINLLVRHGWTNANRGQ